MDRGHGPTTDRTPTAPPGWQLWFLCALFSVGGVFGAPGRILDVSTAALADGLTLVSITASVELDDDSWKWERLSNPARTLIRFRDCDRHPARGNFVTGDPVVRAVRFGYHPEFDRPEIHVVLDLGGSEVHVADIRSAGNTLLIHVVQPDPSPGTIEPSPAAPLPSPSPPPPARVPQATSSPTPTPPSVPNPTPPPSTPPPSSIIQPPGDQHIPQIEEIVMSSRGNGTTTIRITTDTPLGENSFGCYRRADLPPRQVLSLIGVRETNLVPQVSGSQSEIHRIDVRSTPIHRGFRVDLTMDFAADSVGVIEIAHRGKHLVLLVGPIL